MKKYLLLFLLAFFSVEAQIVNIPDANFKAKLLEADANNIIAKNSSGQFFKIDVDGDNEIQEIEAQQVFSLILDDSNIESLEGIFGFTNLSDLECNNNLITEIDFSGFLSLKRVSLDNNPLVSLNVQNTNLEILGAYNTSLTSLDLSGLESLFSVTFVYNTQLTSVNLSNCSSLQIAYFNSNLLSEINLSGCVNLTAFYCNNNQLAEIENFSECISLEILDCSNNFLSVLDLSNFSNLVELYCEDNSITNVIFNQDSSTTLSILELSNNNLTSLDLVNRKFWILNLSFNPLISLFIKNGQVPNGDFTLVLNGCESLQYICTDESIIDEIQMILESYTILNCEVNSYCSFLPGGNYHVIRGNVKLDLNFDGCDETDIQYSNLRLDITNGENIQSVFTNDVGDYVFPLLEGIYTVQPILENTSHFTCTPENFVIEFPLQTSPFIQDFCVSSNPIYDLEVIIIPIEVAIPGFDADYKLVYKNKGNTVVSGSLSLTFTDNVMDFVSSIPVQSMVEPNILNWNYTDLQPLETREILVVFNLNSPQETPGLNGGEILEFIAIIDPLSGDEMPSDNTSTLNQTVVNSYDPNDKTCLEGSVVSPELIGQYVHYVIRFENTGTFFAQNVVVKDEIDLARFDISTLIPQHSSHDYFTRINGNKVEFIFENIQLPFPPSEERHGYIAFKIKLKNDLIVGDTFSNFASIYFDYNFPIITEPATTSIEALSNPDFEFSSFVKLYPNPANSIVKIESQSSINLKSVEIFNSLGQLLQAIPNENNQLNIDVSNLQTGTYFIKVHSDKGVGVSKFVKK